MNNLQEIAALIREANDKGLKIKANDVDGFSGEKLIGVLQRIAKYQLDKGRGGYLEVGVFRGLTLVSVAKSISSTSGIAYGIDNFAFFDKDNKNKNIVNKRVKSNSLNNVVLINKDYEDALECLPDYIGKQKIGTYFIDGPHDYRSQLVCLELIKPSLSDKAVIVIDDCNYRHVRLANRDFLVHNPEFKLLFEAYTSCHPGNMTNTEHKEARKGFWNGVNIIVHDPEDLLDREYPDVIRTRSLYENDHIVHSSKFGVLAPYAVGFISRVLSFKIYPALKSMYTLIKHAFIINKKIKGEYSEMNTFSGNLKKFSLNKKV
jgi:hypothetical protein